MKIGIDIASLSYNNQVDQIILIADDSDFVPAAKLARRDGIDFVLDPLGRSIKEELFEHIDGLKSRNNQYYKHSKQKSPYSYTDPKKLDKKIQRLGFFNGKTQLWIKEENRRGVPVQEDKLSRPWR